MHGSGIQYSEATVKRDLSGQRFGRLTVLSHAPVMRKDGHGFENAWVCRCECGNERTVLTGNLVHGRQVSCGCYQREIRGKSTITHGLAKSRENNIWSGMKHRCNNPHSRAWDRYGGRGIKLCPAWDASFAAFFADMGPAPSPQHSIERIDNDAGYSPENCRWALRRDQNRNTSARRLLTHNGVTLTIAEWAERTGIASRTIRARIDVLKWSVDEALDTPVATDTIS